MLCEYFSLNACNFALKLLSDAYIGLVGPYQYFGWYGPGHTGHTGSAALVMFTHRAGNVCSIYSKAANNLALSDALATLSNLEASLFASLILRSSIHFLPTAGF